MTNRAQEFLKISLWTALLNIFLNLLFIPVFGIEGAAIASATSILWKAVMATRYIKGEYGHSLMFFDFKGLGTGKV